ncbi:MAG TPA: DUF4931 domain-containing protein [Bacilli bacterium]|nr:DUF4931 domain-containing protein [Bacilli bacterium]
MAATHLVFQSNIGRQKPESIVNKSTRCPFCDRNELAEILAEEGSILLVKNKFPVLEDTCMTVLIETDVCHSELSEYPRDHLHRLIRFGVAQWEAMEQSGEYASVIFYKNHGPLSGGTIRHPHMQIVGLNQVDYREHVTAEQFEGLVIDRSPGVAFNISTRPRMGFYELNVVLTDREQIDRMADYIQMAAHYFLHHFHAKCDSYNLFFYRLENGNIAAKILPRFVTTPLFVGYSIPQVASRIPEVVAQLQELYLAQEKHRTP